MDTEEKAAKHMKMIADSVECVASNVSESVEQPAQGHTSSEAPLPAQKPAQPHMASEYIPLQRCNVSEEFLTQLSQPERQFNLASSVVVQGELPFGRRSLNKYAQDQESRSSAGWKHHDGPPECVRCKRTLHLRLSTKGLWCC
eukprot:CAMPEP_0172693710 /NCGR_PEP_ID=MMETSP1074-20121228/26184_1 /TAXON_ID=2916 /ORGANISM="Ceratium fusus, Strain PA161109" /LENGTH=142 /DNA_ID=CAMNT_0013514127 /DNA_START=72 /DNA_END=497 /DNA_ORIENTATION=-